VAKDKPNILVIWGDDIGWFNPSCYHQGAMGYRTPNIDRIAAEGARFTDWYGQQSCTAGRAAFITGQSPIRTGLTKVGLPGAKIGLQPEDATIADLLKPLGYVTGQFGKNHLGDRDEFLPTAHGSNAAMRTRRCTTTAGWSTAPSCSFRRKPWSARSSRPSRSSPRASGGPASASIRRPTVVSVRRPESAASPRSRRWRRTPDRGSPGSSSWWWRATRSFDSRRRAHRSPGRPRDSSAPTRSCC